ncbi:MAG: SDR family oxidoreductase [Devosia sp.]|uniref:SDR family NAD(P)-dependent oxidoreductase n=1 Tax=Devosia sp. TaxID=1871048 RepID=UPI001A494029|nr:SDR family NAD(P)-dependent oxidoreductase [Devosia sp.]MBL8598955.1 SDR family oxidoreductase [Devosia sp.]
MSERLAGKATIVIGGARGIGEGVVDVLVREGASVMLADIRKDLADGVADRFGSKVTAVEADISRQGDMERIAALALERFGRIDILCQVAGIYPVKAIEDLPEEEWDRVLSVNLKGPFLAIRACMPQMKRQKYGRIVLTGSITGPLVSWPEHSAYAASKAGLVGLAKTVAIEGAAHNVTINVIEPGNVDTENVRRERGPGHVEFMSKAVPMGRLATPNDCGEAVAFLASDAASYITGTTLVLDGGQVLLEAKV